MRVSKITRKTAETDISLTLDLDGKGANEINSGCGFLDHMLTLFSKHGGFDLTLTCKGDTQVDYHHICEDIGSCLGKAFAEALGDKRGIVRYGDIVLPMDETLVLAAVDISGRGGYYESFDIPTEKVGDFDTELVCEFFIAFAQNAGMTLHLKKLAGRNSHHIIEGGFKAVARALKAAVAINAADPLSMPSTKGCL